jgi:hypothetical protein
VAQQAERTTLAVLAVAVAVWVVQAVAEAALLELELLVKGIMVVAEP